MHITSVFQRFFQTLAFYLIFTSSAAEYIVFKAGKALSKCFNVIARFSEDIDLVVLNKEGDSGNNLKGQLKTISKSVEEILPEVDVAGITNKKGIIRKTAHSYSKHFSLAFVAAIMFHFFIFQHFNQSFYGYSTRNRIRKKTRCSTLKNGLRTH